MRYDKEVVFVEKSNESYYDPDLGEYVQGENKETGTSASVTDLGTERSVKIFGDVKQGAKVIRTLPLFVLPKFDYIRYKNKTWQVVTQREPQERNSLIVQEVTIDESTP